MDGRMVVGPHLTDKETERVARSPPTELWPRPGFVVLAELSASALAPRVKNPPTL